jgi:hypothetical protein
MTKKPKKEEDKKDEISTIVEETEKFQKELLQFLVEQKVTDGVAILSMANLIVAILQNAPAKDAQKFSEELVKYFEETLPRSKIKQAD